MSFYSDARAKWRQFRPASARASARILASPGFTYRIERDAPGVKPGGVHPVSDVELASRLSFFSGAASPTRGCWTLRLPGGCAGCHARQ
jgi:hypothetical protein